MANPYIEIFKIPGAIAFSASGLVARFPIAMITLGIVTMLKQTHGDYSFASMVATVYVISSACIAPQVSRLADRYGQTKIALPFSLVAATAISSLILASYYHAPNWVLFVCAFFIGFMPSFGAFVRARWSKLCSGSLRLQSAFAFESIIDETIFMVGPIVAINLSTNLFPEAGLAVTILLLVTGCFVFCLQRQTEPAIMPHRNKNGQSVILMPQIQILALTLLAIGSIFGTAEVTALAFATEQGSASNSAYALTAYALGSFIAGIFYGGRTIHMELSRQLVVAITLAALTTLPLLFVHSIWQLVAVLFIAGAACSPTIIIAMRLVENLVTKEKLTEGITWATTGISVGLAIGIAFSGKIIDLFGAAQGFYISVASGFLALFIILIFRKKLETKNGSRSLDIS